MKIKQKTDLALTSSSFIAAAYPAWLARLARTPVRASVNAQPVASHAFYYFQERLAGMSRTKVLVDRLKIGLAIAMLATLTGCIGVVGGGGGWWGGGGWGGDGGWWGGGDRGAMCMALVRAARPVVERLMAVTDTEVNVKSRHGLHNYKSD